MQLKDANAGPDGGLGNRVTLIPIQHRKCHCLFAAMGILSPNYIRYSARRFYECPRNFWGIRDHVPLSSLAQTLQRSTKSFNRAEGNRRD